MTAVGLFAGRGDIVLAMGLALLVGCWAGWQLHTIWTWVQQKREERKEKT